jgi:hypothetical protein
MLNLFVAFANRTNEQTQRALLTFDSTVHTLPQMAAYAAQILFSAVAQMAAISEQAMQCMMQTVNSTFAGTQFSALTTRTNTTAASG